MSDSKGREVKMLDAVDHHPEGATGEDQQPASAKLSSQANGHADVSHMTDNGHQPSDSEVNDLNKSERMSGNNRISEKRKMSEEHSPSEEHSAKTTSNGYHTSAPIPSIETDDHASLTASRMIAESPAIEDRHKGVSTASPKSPSHVSLSKQQTQTESVKLHKEMARFKEVLNEISSKAAQKVMRDNWRTFLFDRYDEEHISFVLRAGLKNSNFSILERILKDEHIFKEPFVIAASLKGQVRKQVLKHVTAGELLEHVPEAKLDKALAERIKTAPAKKLINWLSDGLRLGFNHDDILEDDESVTPNIHSRPASQTDVDMKDRDEVFEVERAHDPDLALPHRDPLLAEQDRNAAALSQSTGARYNYRTAGPMVCNVCHVQFPTFSGYNYHTTKKVCQKKPPNEPYKWYCDNCIQGFTTKQGKEYHTIKGVCHGDDIAPATAPSSQPPQAANSRPEQTSRTASGSGLPTFPRPGFITQPQPQNQTNVYRRYLTSQQLASSEASQPPQQAKGQFEVVIPSPSKARSEAVTVPPRPPLYTPAPSASTSTPSTRKQQPPSDIRSSPLELPAERLAELNRQLDEADQRYAQGQHDIPATWSNEAKQAKLTSLKNANASRKSQIRKSFGVTLRMREKDKLAQKAMAASVSSSTTAVPSTMSRPRIDSSRSSQNHSSSPAGTLKHALSPPTTGFSPVNHPPPRTGPSPQSTRSPHSTPHPSSVSASASASTSTTTSGFGILRSQPVTLPTPHQYQGPYANPNPNPNKRRHESKEHERRPSSTGLSRNDGPYTGNVTNPYAFDQQAPRDPPPTQHQGLEVREINAEKLGNKNWRNAVETEKRQYGSPYSAPAPAAITPTNLTATTPTEGNRQRNSSNTKESAIAIGSSSSSSSDDDPAAPAEVVVGSKGKAKQKVVADNDETEDEGRDDVDNDDDTEDEQVPEAQLEKKRGFTARRGGRRR